ncbi:MAG: LCP family protein, partial [Clostridia bacterium]|nr:LCP family protein [Clostridia bacterium]
MAEIYRPDPAGKAPEKETPKKKKLTPLSKALIALAVVVGVILIVVAAYHLIIEHYIRMIQAPPTDEVYATRTIEQESETETITEELPIVVLPTEHNGELNDEGLPLICDTRAVKNILLIGIDARARGNEAGLSDSMMILSINSDTKTISLTSLERDTLVQIPGHGQEKLTHAHAYGGADLLIQTLKDNFNIEIQYWARVNFYSFVDIVDAMGGLDVEMSASEVHYMNFYLLEINDLYGRPRGTDNLAEKAGVYHL